MCRTDFVVTASRDGHVKFWKKKEEEIEFVKHFRAHLSMTLSQLYIKLHENKVFIYKSHMK